MTFLKIFSTNEMKNNEKDIQGLDGKIIPLSLNLKVNI